MYISSNELSPEVLSYYSKVLKIGGVTNPEKRFTVLASENNNKFPSHFSLTQLILYSPKCIKRLQRLAEDKFTYIVPGIMSFDEVKLAV